MRESAVALLVLLLPLMACSSDSPTPDDVARQQREALEAFSAAEPPHERLAAVVDALRVALASVEEAKSDRLGGSLPAPPPVRRACGEVGQAARHAEAAPGPHPPGYDEAARDAADAAADCLSNLDGISAARPSRVVNLSNEARLTEAVTRVEPVLHRIKDQAPR